ncbi:MAG: peptidoglycan binding domain-containing protein [Eubacteriales bacterium]|nr:peptidoglycan binding domain-containing protein [Eubacteriales bacterium]
MKKIIKTILILLCVVGIPSGALYGGHQFINSHFPPNTYLNGFEAGLLTTEEAQEIIEKSVSEQTFSVIWEDETEEEIPMTSFSWTVKTAPSLQELCKTESLSYWFSERDKMKVLATAYQLDPDEKELKEALSELNCVKGIGTEEPTEAHIARTDNRYKIVESVVGTRVDADALFKEVNAALTRGVRSVRLAEVQCYAKADIDSSDEHLQYLLAKAEEMEACSIQLDLSGVSETIDWSIFGSWMTMDDQGEFTLDEDALRTYVKSLAEQYDTYGKERQFITAQGNTITVGGGKLDCYGFTMDTEATTDAILDLLDKKESGDVSAVWTQSGATHGLLNDFGDAYIEVSIQDQTMWYIRSGEILLSTKVVTGMETEERRTPTGVYMILDKKKNHTMRGSYGTAYCNFLIAISHDGICIHDSPWRSNYGGDIYISSGSHGCINTPYSAMQSLYEAETNYGMPVIVY